MCYIVLPNFAFEDGAEFDFKISVLQKIKLLPKRNELPLVLERDLNSPATHELDVEAVPNLSSVKKRFNFIPHGLVQGVGLQQDLP
jgi:hypothetical protein